MPCSDAGQAQYYDSIELKKRQERIDNLEAVLCAIFNEIESRGIIDEIIDSAEKNGQIEIKDLWVQHQLKDRHRLMERLSSFSKHERKLLKIMLQEEE